MIVSEQVWNHCIRSQAPHQSSLGYGQNIASRCTQAEKLYLKQAMTFTQNAMDEPDIKFQAATPCGLGNLGATCYANGALQCLFMNLAFREGLFAVEPPVADDAIIGSLRSAPRLSCAHLSRKRRLEHCF
jgi:hypothetical protein